MTQIRVERLTKTFKVGKRQAGLWSALKGVARREYVTVRALDGVSFTVDKGELVGYVGPNGAGKSTTVKILSGILVPDGGVCQVMGRTPWLDRIGHVAHIGVVFGQRCQLWWDLPVADSFELLRDVYRVPAAQYIRTRDALVDRLDLAGLLETPVRQLSLGQRMRCDIAASLLHSPPLVFLDEPTIGLDAVAKLAVRDFVRELNRENGTTVILTTHDMDDIESLCQRVIVIGRGTILIDGSLADLRARVPAERRLLAEMNGADVVVPLRGVTSISREGGRACLHFDPAVIAPAELVSWLAEHYEVRDFLVEDLPIEQTVARLYAELGL